VREQITLFLQGGITNNEEHKCCGSLSDLQIGTSSLYILHDMMQKSSPIKWLVQLYL
jgi:hypothetical protein